MVGRLARKVEDEDVLNVRGDELCARGGGGVRATARGACVRLAPNLGSVEGRCRTCEGDVLGVDEVGVPCHRVVEGDQAACVA